MSENIPSNAAEARERKRARFEPQAKRSNTPVRAGAIVAIVAAVLAMGYMLGRGSGGDAAPRVDPHSAASKPGVQVPASAAGGARPAGPSGASAADATTVAADGDVVRVPVGKGPNHVAFFKANAGGKVVPFFVAKDAAGQDHVAFDACQNCASAKKGYVQQGDRMKCNNCGDTFPISNITKMGGQGGCHPISVPADQTGDSIVVKASDLAVGARYF